MNIAELFVNLGVKGSDKTLSAISQTRTGLKETASVAWETKAALVGVMYALERTFAASSKFGTGMMNFGAMFGGGTQILQKYQYAARQVGVSNEALEGTFRSLAATSTKILRGEARPAGLAQMAVATKTNMRDLYEAQTNPAVLMQKLQEYANIEKNIGQRNAVLKSFGLSDDVIGALGRNAFRPDVLAKAPTYSDKELSQLDKANAAWSNIGTEIDMAIGHFNAAHGVQMAKDVGGVVKNVEALANAFERLSNHLKLFEKIDTILQGWKIIFDGLTDAVDAVTDTLEGGDAAKESAVPNAVAAVTNTVAEPIFGADFAEQVHKAMNTKIHVHLDKDGKLKIQVGEEKPVIPSKADAPLSKAEIQALGQPAKQNPATTPAGAVAPSAVAPGAAPVAPGPTAAPTKNIEVNQTFNLPAGTDAKGVGDSTSHAVVKTFRQLQQGGGF